MIKHFPKTDDTPKAGQKSKTKIFLLTELQLDQEYRWYIMFKSLNQNFMKIRITQHNQHLQHPQYQQEKHGPTSIYLFQTGCFRFEQQLREQKLRVFVCSELLWALDSNKTLFPLKEVKCSVKKCLNLNWFSGHPTAYKKLPTPLKSFQKKLFRKKSYVWAIEGIFKPKIER